MKFHFILFISVLVLTGSACNILSPETGSGGNPQPGAVLFQDDFSDPSSGWDRITINEGVTDYVDGTYRISVNSNFTDVWANPGLNFSDVRVEVDAIKVGGDDNNDYGVICRYQDSENFYFFIVSSDGYYGIGKVVGGVQQLIGEESMPPSELINQGSVSNRLSAVCAGSNLSLYVNGNFLTEVVDVDFTSGDVGLVAGTFDQPGVDVYFDNFMVTNP